MSKHQLIEAILAGLRAELEIAQNAARTAHEAATHEESKAEDQYDTRGLEASYLAGAQANRSAELEKQIAYFKFLNVRDFNSKDSVQPGAVVELDCDGKISTYFFASQGGGISVKWGGKNVQVITPASPLGESISGRVVGDLIEIESAKQSREFEIISLK